MTTKSSYDIASKKINRGDLDGAYKLFKKLLETNKNDLRALEGMSYVCLVSKKFEECLIYLDHIIPFLPPNPVLQYRKTIAHLRLLQIVEGINSFEFFKKLDPSHPDIQSLQLEINQLLENQKDDNLKYISKRFDLNAEAYDNGRNSVSYDAPKLLFKALSKTLKGTFGRVLDLGCGTGLSGGYLRERSDYLIGIDISENMLNIAYSKKIYDELVNEDIIQYLELQNQNSCNAIMAASVVVYFGDLNKFLANIKRILANNGVFVFDVLTQKYGKWSSASPEGRIFSHNPEYIKAEVISAGLKCDYFYTSTFKYISSEHSNPGAVFTITKN